MRVILLFLISFSCFAQFTSDSVRKIDIIRPASTTAIIASGTLKIQDGTEGTTAHVLYSSGTEGEITWAALPSSTALVSETLVDGRIAFGSTTNVISSTSELVYNYLDNILEVSGTVTAAHLNASSTVTAITYYGDGSNLTGISGGASSLIGLSDTPVGYGTAGQVLTSDGISTTTWTTPSTGGVSEFVTTTYASGMRVDGCLIQNTGTVSKLTANCDPWVTILGRPALGQVDLSHQAYLSKGVCTVTINAALGVDESCYIRSATQTTTYLMVFCQNGGGTGLDRNFSIICTGETAL